MSNLKTFANQLLEANRMYLKTIDKKKRDMQAAYFKQHGHYCKDNR